MVAIARSSGLFPNNGPPHYITNAGYPPPGYIGIGNSVTTTSTRCYYFPLAIYEAHTFQGALSYNGGSGDNGEKYRMMVFRDLPAGGPGALEKDFGEVTLTGAAALRTLTSSWAAAPGMYWGAMWFESATSMTGMSPAATATAVGASLGLHMVNVIGDLSPSATFGLGAFPVAHYVDTTYGAAPVNAVAPTASIVAAFGVTTPVIPEFRLKG